MDIANRRTFENELLKCEQTKHIVRQMRKCCGVNKRMRGKISQSMKVYTPLLASPLRTRFVLSRFFNCDRNFNNNNNVTHTNRKMERKRKTKWQLITMLSTVKIHIYFGDCTKRFL